MIRYIFILAISFILWNAHSSATTIAISYFDNNGGEAQYNALSKGITDMLITDLSRIEGLIIVEREKLEALLEEIKLGQSKYFDQTTAQKLGKGLGAESILTGAFMVIDDQIRIDARLIDIETSEVLFAEKVNGPVNNFFEVHENLVGLLSDALKLSREQMKMTKLSYKPVSLAAVVNYSRAIDNFDQGFQTEAVKSLEKVLQDNPEFFMAEDMLDQVRQNMIIIDKQRQEIIDKRIEEVFENIDLSSENLGHTLNSSWTTLISSYSYQAMLQFNAILLEKGVDLDAFLFGPEALIRVGEMLFYYNVLAYSTLKMHEEVIVHGQDYMKRYPASNYFASVRMIVTSSINTIQEQKKGAENIDHLLQIERLDEYNIYLYKFSWSPEFLTKKDKDKFRMTVENEVFNFFDTYQEYNEEFDAGDLKSLFGIALRIDEPKLAEQIMLLAFDLAKNTDDEEDAYDMEEDLDENREKARDNHKKREEYRAAFDTAKTEELHKFVRRGYSFLRIDAFDLVEDISLVYLRSEDNRDKDDVVNSRFKAWNNLFDLYYRTKNIEKFEQTQHDFQRDRLIQGYDPEEFNEMVKDEKKRMRSLHSSYADYVERIIDYPIEQNILEGYAAVCSWNDQFMEEIRYRKKLIKNFELSSEDRRLHLYRLFTAYSSLGLFDEARKYGNQLIEEAPESSDAFAIKTLLPTLPR